jgi:twitching motility protein PilT
MAIDTASLHELLRIAIHYGASDVHLRAGDAPGLRVGDDLAALKVDKLMPSDTLEAARIILASHGRTFDEKSIREVDVGYGVPGLPGHEASVHTPQCK